MLSKEDYREYLQEILEVEETMRDVYGRCVDSVQDSEIRDICFHLMEAETRHATLVRQMIDLFESSFKNRG